MSESIRVRVNGEDVVVPPGTVAAAAAARAGVTFFRLSVGGDRRGPLCGMGICFECRMTIDGRPHQRGCMVVCENGMELQTDESA